MTEDKITGKRIYIKQLKTGDVNQKYLNWINDKKLTKYMECRWNIYSMDDLKDYVKNLKKTNEYLFGIFRVDNDDYIGNIKIGPVDIRYKKGDIGFFIGDENSRGKGYATEAIELIVCFAFEELNLNKVTAGCYSENIGSEKSLIKNGFKLAGVFKEDCIFNNEFIDCFKFELLKKEWELNKIRGNN